MAGRAKAEEDTGAEGSAGAETGEEEWATARGFRATEAGGLEAVEAGAGPATRAGSGR